MPTPPHVLLLFSFIARYTPTVPAQSMDHSLHPQNACNVLNLASHKCERNGGTTTTAAAEAAATAAVKNWSSSPPHTDDRKFN